MDRGVGIAVFCVGQHLTSVPSNGYPHDTEELYLKDNNIKHLRPASFAGLTSLKTIVMANCNITSMESNTFSSLQHLASLDLTSNNIGELRPHTFSGLSSLRRLILDTNSIQVIHNFAFHGLNLTKLSLENNHKLSKLSPKAFYGARVQELSIYNSIIDSNSTVALKSLHSSLRTLSLKNNKRPIRFPPDIFHGFRFNILDLNHNGITDVSFLRYTSVDDLSLANNPIGPVDFSQFPELKHVRNLKLDNTRFSELYPQYFRDMTDLSQLYLRDNNITTVSEKLKPILNQLSPSLNRLDLDRNTLHCNCEMEWFKHWISSAHKVHVRGASCYTPVRDHILSIHDDQFQCTPPTMVHITQTVNVSETAMMSITCTGRGDPAPDIIWIRPNGERKETLPSLNKSIRVNTGELTIDYVRQSDAGVYTCIIKNPAGKASAISTVEVYHHPGLTSKERPGLSAAGLGANSHSHLTSGPLMWFLCLWQPLKYLLL